MVKKIWAVVILLAICSLFFTFGANAEGNLCVNGGFEDVSENMPVGWSTDVWNKTEGDAQFIVEDEGAYSGKNCVTIQNTVLDDVKFIQTIGVKPETTYKFSCYVKAEGVTLADKVGANISVINLLVYSDSFHDTNGKWEYVEFYGKTSKTQTEVQVAARIGGYGLLNSGKASFDEYVVEEVAEVPAEVNVINLYREAPSQNSNTDPTKTDTGNPITTNNILNWIAFAIVVILCLFIIFNKKMDNRVQNYKNKQVITMIILGITVLVRLLISVISSLNSNTVLMVSTLLFIIFIVYAFMIIFEYFKNTPSNPSSDISPKANDVKAENIDVNEISIDDDEEEKKKLE